MWENWRTMSVASRTRSRRKQAAETAGPSRRDNSRHYSNKNGVILIDIDSSDGDDDDDVDGDSSDDPVTPPSTTEEEDNDDSDDLDYGEDDEPESDMEEEARGNSSGNNHIVEDGIEIVSETPAVGERVGGKRRRAYIEEEEEEEDEVEVEDVIDLTQTQARPRGRGRPSGSGSGKGKGKGKRFDLLKVLADSIMDGPSLEEALSLSLKEEEEEEEEEEEDEEETEPLKQEEEEEEELGDIWSEMQFCLASSDIASTSAHPPPPASMVQDEDAKSSKAQLDQATLCRQGNHELILDEEIGMICKFCGHVQLEIRYVVAPFLTQSCGNFESRYSSMVDSFIFDGLHDQDFDIDVLDRDSNKDDEGTVWEIVPKIKDQLYPHQCEGFEFIWNNIAGGIYRDKSRNNFNGVGGCVISHAPGTGKSLLIIAFLYTYLKEYPNCRPVIVAPRSMLLTWEAEFRKWKVDIPFHNLNTVMFSGKEKTKGIGLYEKYKHTVSDRHLAIRLVKLLSWKSDGGVLGISYGLFKQLAGRPLKGKGRCATIDKHVSKILLELPGLLVLDEGHIARNDDTIMWKALSMIKTERRIILSGTPFQNNFDELYHTLRLVRPKFTQGVQQVSVTRRGRKKDKEHRKWVSLTGSIGKAVDRFEAKDLKQLRSVIRPFVHVHKGTILQTNLPGLRHSVVVLQPSDLQKQILERLKEIKSSLILNYAVSLVAVHPSLLLQQLHQLSDQQELMESIESIVSMDELERIRMKPDRGVKTKFIKQLIKFSEALNEKVIIFSQYLEPLKLVMDQLKDSFRWKEGEEILYMHGNSDIKQRQSSINAFNDPSSRARVLLASIKACSEGINLVGGSRVVLLDVTWNPSVERQAISRAYRLGQKKVVYIYHLISSGTMEGLKCSRQAGKDRLSELVFSFSDKGGDEQKKNVSDVFEDKILEEMCQHEKLKSMFEKIINQPKDTDLIETFGDL